MRMLTDRHCLVDLSYRHPVLGILHAERMQRLDTECEQIIQEKRIKWQSFTLRAEKVLVLKRENVPNLMCPMWLTVIVTDPVV